MNQHPFMMSQCTFFRSLLLALLAVVCLPLAANNIEVSHVGLASQNTGNQTTQVEFDLSWENSWRISVGPANWDAAWVFVKYRINGDLWQHATESTKSLFFK